MTTKDHRHVTQRLAQLTIVVPDRSGARVFGRYSTERIWREECVKAAARAVARAVLRKLAMVHAAAHLEDLRTPRKPFGTAQGGIARAGAVSVPTTSDGSVSYAAVEGSAILYSSTTTDLFAPIHPGEILMQDFIGAFGKTQNKVALAIGVPPLRINEIAHGKRGVMVDTAIRLAMHFGTSAEFWMNLQLHDELRIAGRAHRAQIGSVEPTPHAS